VTRRSAQQGGASRRCGTRPCGTRGSGAKGDSHTFGAIGDENYYA